jgi:hypothetical protein
MVQGIYTLYQMIKSKWSWIWRSLSIPCSAKDSSFWDFYPVKTLDSSATRSCRCWEPVGEVMGLLPSASSILFVRPCRQKVPRFESGSRPWERKSCEVKKHLFGPAVPRWEGIEQSHRGTHFYVQLRRMAFPSTPEM